MKRKAIIFGLKGTKLSNLQKVFLKKTKPWGIILFSRNVKNLNQLKKFILDIKKCFNDKNYPILIDQEGGQVSRLNKIITCKHFSQEYFGKLYKINQKLFYNQYEMYINRTCDILNEVGININTVPVLDIRRNFTSNIIKNRSFSSNPNLVSKLGKICIDLYSNNKIATVIKHIPGHGLSSVDSHKKLPIINASKSYLTKNDFYPFKNCNSFFSMTAHVLYSKYDPNFVATHSKIIINEVIKKKIGFKGIIISDDISMKALKYNLKNNAILSYDAGCHLILHCNGNLNEMIQLSKVAPYTSNFVNKKTSQFYTFLR